MKNCLKCNATYDDHLKFCPTCGNALQEFGKNDIDPLIGKVLANNFRLEKLMGIGGMGKVYLAKQISLDKKVCLKILHSQMMTDANIVRRFYVEAKAASRLNHPNSINIIDFGQTEEELLFIVMEYLAGQDLENIIREQFPLTLDRVINISTQVLGALHAAHTNNIIHRDLKPENIMVEDRPDQKDFVKVLDFGIAKIQEPDSDKLTRVGMVCGTPEYMSPEQAQGLELDPRSDIYSMGVIIFQMLSGQTPFKGENPMAILNQHLQNTPPAISELVNNPVITSAMEQVVKKALAKIPNQRFSNAMDMRETLLNLLQDKKKEPPKSEETAAGGTQLFIPQVKNEQKEVPQPKVEETEERQIGDRLDHDEGKKPKKQLFLIALLVVAILGAAIWFFGSKPKESTPEENLAVITNTANSLAQNVKKTEQIKPTVKPKPVDKKKKKNLDKKPLKKTSKRPKKPEIETKERQKPQKISDKPAKKLYQEADAEFVNGNLERAISLYEQTIIANPTLTGAFKKLGMCYMQKGDSLQAKKYFQLYLQAKPLARDKNIIKGMMESLEAK